MLFDNRVPLRMDGCVRRGTDALKVQILSRQETFHVALCFDSKVQLSMTDAVRKALMPLRRGSIVCDTVTAAKQAMC